TGPAPVPAPRRPGRVPCRAALTGSPRRSPRSRAPSAARPGDRTPPPVGVPLQRRQRRPHAPVETLRVADDEVPGADRAVLQLPRPRGAGRDGPPVRPGRVVGVDVDREGRVAVGSTLPLDRRGQVGDGQPRCGAVDLDSPAVGPAKVGVVHLAGDRIVVDGGPGEAQRLDQELDRGPRVTVTEGRYHGAHGATVVAGGAVRPGRREPRRAGSVTARTGRPLARPTAAAPRRARPPAGNPAAPPTPG